MKYSFLAADGTSFETELGEPDALPAAYVLSVHKAGSTLLNRMATQIARAAGRPVFALPTLLFTNGVKLGDCPQEAVDLLERPGTVFTGFRTTRWLDDIAQYHSAPKFFLVRDPRDIAVSAYFSSAFSHGIPKGGTVRERMLRHREKVKTMDLSEFVMRGSANAAMRNTLAFIEHIDRYENFTVRRYEDVIFEKRKLTDDIARVLSVDLPEPQRAQIASRNDVRPDEERPHEHIRQVKPGNHKQHLSPEACEYLESTFAPIFSRFGYA